MPPKRRAGRKGETGKKDGRKGKKKQLPQMPTMEPHEPDEEGEAMPGEAREEERMQEDARPELVRLQAVMLEAEVDVEEVVVEEQQLKKKRLKATPVTKVKAILENEDAIVEWAATHPELYNRGHSDYYIKEAKDRAYADKAAMYPDLTGKQLEKWLTGMRDRYAKVSNEIKQKSGAGAAKITARNQYIKEKFAFLKPYISRHKGTTAGLGEAVEEPPVDEGSNESCDEGSTLGSPLGPTLPHTEADRAELSLEVLARPSTSNRIGKGTKGKGKGKKVVKAKDSPDTLRASTEEVMGLLKHAVDRPTPSPAEAFGQYLASVSTNIHPQLLSSWRREAVEMANRYLDQSDTITQQEQQQKQRAQPTRSSSAPPHDVFIPPPPPTPPHIVGKSSAPTYTTLTAACHDNFTHLMGASFQPLAPTIEGNDAYVRQTTANIQPEINFSQLFDK